MREFCSRKLVFFECVTVWFRSQGRSRKDRSRSRHWTLTGHRFESLSGHDCSWRQYDNCLASATCQTL